MRAILKDNKIPVEYLARNGVNLLNRLAVLRDVKTLYKTDADGKKTDDVVGYRYDCIDVESFSTFSVKVESRKPVITQEALESSELPIYVELPLEQVTIRPYSIEYGIAKVSICADFIKLHKED